MVAIMELLLVCVVAFVASVSGYGHLNYPVLCSKLKPVKHLELKELQGTWLTVEALLLRDGFPEPPANPRRNTCVKTILSDASESGMSSVSEVHLGSAKRRTGRTKFLVSDPEEPGRWNMMSKRPTSLTSEMLVLAAHPGKFMVLAFCQPTSEDNEEDEGDRPALWVKILMARQSGGDIVTMDPHAMGNIRHKVKEMLGLRELTSVHFDTSC